MAWQLYVLEFPNGKRYLGVTSETLKRRWGAHKRAYGYGARYPVNIAINKYGSDNIVPRTLVVGDEDYILDLEVKAIAAFQTRNPKNGYNVALGGRAGLSVVPEIAARAGRKKRGVPLSPDHCEKISAAHKGKTLSEAHKASVSKTLTGRTLSPEVVQKISAKLKGRTQTPAHIEKRAAKKRGSKHSTETRLKISASQVGRSRGPYSPEHGEAISVALKKRFKHFPPSVAHLLTPEVIAKRAEKQRGTKRGPQSPELIEKRIAKIRGRKRSAESKARMSAAAKLREQIRREEKRRKKEQEIARPEN